MPELKICTIQDLSEAERRQLAVLLSRAYTDERHLSRYPAETLQAIKPFLAAARAEDPAARRPLPESWLRQFPTMRSILALPRPSAWSIHVLLQQDGRFVAHASLWERQVWIGEVAEFTMAFVEDVATDLDVRGLGYG